MNRADFQQIAEQRLREAIVLRDGGHWDGAYYLVGYAVECALKACIAKQTKAFDFPDKKLTDASYTHDLSKLAAAAALTKDIEDKKNADTYFAANWKAVVGWNEQARYERWTENQARDLMEAVEHPTNGVLQWLRTRW